MTALMAAVYLKYADIYRTSDARAHGVYLQRAYRDLKDVNALRNADGTLPAVKQQQPTLDMPLGVSALRPTAIDRMVRRGDNLMTVGNEDIRPAAQELTEHRKALAGLDRKSVV